MKLLIMQFSPASCHFISLQCKYCLLFYCGELRITADTLNSLNNEYMTELNSQMNSLL
jgi:hypothetical protein